MSFLPENGWYGGNESCDDRAERLWREAGSPTEHERGNVRSDDE